MRTGARCREDHWRRIERLQRCDGRICGSGVPLHVLVSDPDSGKIVGGITGRKSLGLMFIDLVYLPEILRGRDIGARMMALAEEEARRRGCRAGVLYTISFQAPEFYNRLGWRVFGEIPCDPPGTSRVFLTKDFL